MHSIEESTEIIIAKGNQIKTAKNMTNSTLKELRLVSDDNTLNMLELTTILNAKAKSDLPYTNIDITGSFTERTTANGVTIVDNSISEIKEIDGETVRCENLLNIEDVNETTVNGITWKFINCQYIANGTATAQTDLNVYLKSSLALNGTYSFSAFNNQAMGTIRFFSTYPSNVSLASYPINILNSTYTYNFDNKSLDFLSLRIPSGTVLSNFILKPMLIFSSYPSNKFQPCFTGLKNSYINKLTTTNGTETIDNPNSIYGAIPNTIINYVVKLDDVPTVIDDDIPTTIDVNDTGDDI